MRFLNVYVLKTIVYERKKRQYLNLFFAGIPFRHHFLRRLGGPLMPPATDLFSLLRSGAYFVILCDLQFSLRASSVVLSSRQTTTTLDFRVDPIVAHLVAVDFRAVPILIVAPLLVVDIRAVPILTIAPALLVVGIRAVPILIIAPIAAAIHIQIVPTLISILTVVVLVTAQYFLLFRIHTVQITIVVDSIEIVNLFILHGLLVI